MTKYAQSLLLAEMQLTGKVYTAAWSFTVYTYDTLLIRAIALTLREKRSDRKLWKYDASASARSMSRHMAPC